MNERLLASVLVTVTGDRRIYRLVESLLHQTVPLDRYEIIVVEDGSSQFEDLGAIGGGAVRYLHTHMANVAMARNIGLDVAKGRYLLLTDADVVTLPDWIERMVKHLNAGCYAGVGGRIYKLNRKTWVQRYAITIVDGQSALSYLPALSLPYVAAANAGFITAAVREVGGFNPRFLSGNDVDICYRLGLRGYKIGLAPDAGVLHEDRPDILSHFRRFKRYATFQVLLFATYRHVSHRRLVINRYPLKRTAQALGGIPQGIFGLLRGDIGPSSRVLLQLVEAAGVWCGDIEGSIRYRQLYI